MITEVREIELDADDAVDAVIKADQWFNPTAETLIENKGRIREPKIISVMARDKH